MRRDRTLSAILVAFGAAIATYFLLKLRAEGRDETLLWDYTYYADNGDTWYSTSYTIDDPYPN